MTLDLAPRPEHADLDFDPDALREKYRQERDKRIRTDGNEQYQQITGELAEYMHDPHVEPGFMREALTDEVEVVIIGGGFSGLVTGMPTLPARNVTSPMNSAAFPLPLFSTLIKSLDVTPKNDAALPVPPTSPTTSAVLALLPPFVSFITVPTPSPTIWSFALGVVVPMPTFPLK